MKILIVDDSKSDVMIISGMLSEYELTIAYDGSEAMACIMEDPEINIVLLDLNMPRMNGFEVLEALRLNPEYQRISVLILTNHDEVENEIRGLELGAVDYIRKPLNLQSLKKRIEVHCKLWTARNELEQQNFRLEEKVVERTKECNITRDVTIHAMVGLLEARNIESSNHTRRTQLIMKLLCDHLRTKLSYKDVFTDAYVNELVSTAPLHDIGKVGIPDYILLKPGKLTNEEFEIMKMHPVFGVNALEYAGDQDICPSFIQTALEIVGSHHERFDGAGYPYGLKTTDIPLPGRLMSIVDVYDALVSARVYKPAYPHSMALRIIAEGKGTQFDPEITDAFLEISDKIKMVADRYGQQLI